MEDLISVIITSFNRGVLLDRAVQSVLSQSYKSFEILIVDDCSTDVMTKDVLKKYEAREFANVKVIRMNKNSGSNVCRNYGIKYASGVFYTGLDDDDYFLKDRLVQLLNKFDPGYSFLCDNFFIKKGRKLKKRFLSGKVLNLKDMVLENQAGNQVFTTLERIRGVGGFDPNLRKLQDQDLWLRLIEKYGPALRANLRSYVMDVGHDSERITSKYSNYLAYEALYKKHWGCIPDNIKPIAERKLSVLKSGRYYCIGKLILKFDRIKLDIL
ncbi:MAG: glycosyltransferase [Alteromonadaceae bacterium]|nr:glycosyltransferase [Alteromonadaceae bacterium]